MSISSKNIGEGESKMFRLQLSDRLTTDDETDLGKSTVVVAFLNDSVFGVSPKTMRFQQGWRQKFSDRGARASDRGLK